MYIDFIMMSVLCVYMYTYDKYLTKYFDFQHHYIFWGKVNLVGIIEFREVIITMHIAV